MPANPSQSSTPKASPHFRWKLFAAGLVAITAGYVLLAVNDITIAPVLLVLGYCILVPLAFL
ncbi:MAG TPA: hypothetical protein VEC56_00175 [Candidatus Krumholzibacteria bacterium]|nr:hypothetical protein [Candidatus Krumholzibacteria bacterium]